MVAERLRGMYLIVRELPGQRRVPFLPREATERARDERVRELVRYAAEHVPHYRDLLRRERIDPREIRTADDLSHLPLLEKAQLQEAHERFHAHPAPDGLVLRSAGSTGQPVEILRDRRSLLASIAYDERERAVERHFAGKRYRYSVAQIVQGQGNLSRIRELYARSSFRPFRPRLREFDMAASPEEMLAELDRLRPEVIRGSGTYLELMFRTALARGIELRGPRVVGYGSDQLSPEGVKLIEERFGLPVISRYGASEVTKIGFFCERRTGFHLNEDLAHIAIAAPDGGPVEAGRVGEVVATDLVNRGTVIVNYRLGDLAALLPGPCGCGRTTRVLTALEGRVSAIVHLPDGTAVHPLRIETRIRYEPGVLRFQLVQTERELFDLRLVTADEATYRRVAEPIARALRELFGGAPVRTERREALTDDRPKFRSVIALEDQS